MGTQSKSSRLYGVLNVLTAKTIVQLQHVLPRHAEVSQDSYLNETFLATFKYIVVRFWILNWIKIPDFADFMEFQNFITYLVASKMEVFKLLDKKGAFVINMLQNIFQKIPRAKQISDRKIMR